MNANLSLLATLTLAVTECGRPNPDIDLRLVPAQQSSNRIQVERVGVFNDGVAYGNSRGIYIIRDTQTGKEFIGVSGIGISETGSHQSGKIHLEDER